MRSLRLFAASVRDFGIVATLDELPMYLLSPLTACSTAAGSGPE